MLHKLKTNSGQADVISVVILVGISLAVGIAIVALFTAQSSTARGQVDVSNAISEEASNEFMTLIYHGYSVVNDSYNEHVFIYKFVMISRTGRNYFLILPLITLGKSNSFLAYETSLFWKYANFYLLVPDATHGNYSLRNATVLDVPGNKVFLGSGLALGISNTRIIKLSPTITKPFVSSYLEIRMVVPNTWNSYYLTVVTLTEISNSYYSLEQISTFLGGI